MAIDWAELGTPGKPETTATDEMLADFRRDFGVHTYQIGWLNQVIRQAEENLERAMKLKCSPDVLDAVLRDVITLLRSGRENAEAEAKKNAR